MSDDKLAAEEARRAMQHQAVKSDIERDVHADIAARTPRPDRQEVREVARDLQRDAVHEVAQTERELGRARGAARSSQVIDYIFFLVYALLALRLALNLMAARSSAPFVSFVDAVTDPLMYPFTGIVPSPSADGGYTLALPIVIALIVYAILHMAINRILRMMAHRKTEV